MHYLLIGKKLWFELSTTLKYRFLFLTNLWNLHILFQDQKPTMKVIQDLTMLLRLGMTILKNSQQCYASF